MSAVCDCHGHIYPCYDIPKALETAWVGLEAAINSLKLSPDSVRMLCLAERYDCFFFQDLVTSLSRGKKHDSFKVKATKEQNSLILELSGGRQLILLAGRQIVTAERVEVLALSVDLKISDGLSFMDVYHRILQSEGICVINWAPGKWFFKRGKFIRSLICSEDLMRIFLGDTTLRPNIWPKPWLMRRGESLGRKILCGSDPLPLKGEERYLGRYGILCSEEISLDYPAKDLRAYLNNPRTTLKTFGSRGNVLEVFYRIFRYELFARRRKQVASGA